MTSLCLGWVVTGGGVSGLGVSVGPEKMLPIFIPNMEGAESSFCSAGLSSWNMPADRPLKPEKRPPVSGCGCSCCGLLVGAGEGELENSEPKGLAVSVTPDMNPKLGVESPGMSKTPLGVEGSGSVGGLGSSLLISALLSCGAPSPDVSSSLFVISGTESLRISASCSPSSGAVLLDSETSAALVSGDAGFSLSVSSVASD